MSFNTLLSTFYLMEERSFWSFGSKFLFLTFLIRSSDSRLSFWIGRSGSGCDTVADSQCDQLYSGSSHGWFHVITPSSPAALQLYPSCSMPTSPLPFHGCTCTVLQSRSIWNYPKDEKCTSKTLLTSHFSL